MRATAPGGLTTRPRALLALARTYGQGPVLIADLAEKERIPKKFLELLLLELKNAGILQSKKGKAKPYQIKQFLELVELYNLELGGSDVEVPHQRVFQRGRRRARHRALAD